MPLVNEIRNCCRAFVNLLYPDTCVLCNGDLCFDEDGVCHACKKTITVLQEPVCRRCAYELPPYVPVPAPCPACHSRKMYFKKTHALIRYDDIAKKIFYEIKFRKRRALLNIFDSSIAQKLKKIAFTVNNAIIIPVPLEFYRKHERDFNQSEIIAHKVSTLTGIPYTTRVLKRVKKSTPQSMLRRKERLHNLINAFKVMQSATINHKDIILIDDVFTTGTTVNECAKVLTEAGAQTVTVFTLARTI